MAKVRVEPWRVARAGANSNWFSRLDGIDQAWMNKLVEEIATVEDPAYYTIALSVIEIINPGVHEITVVRFLKKKVKQCHEKSQAK